MLEVRCTSRTVKHQKNYKDTTCKNILVRSRCLCCCCYVRLKEELWRRMFRFCVGTYKGRNCKDHTAVWGENKEWYCVWKWICQPCIKTLLNHTIMCPRWVKVLLSDVIRKKNVSDKAKYIQAFLLYLLFFWYITHFFIICNIDRWYKSVFLTCSVVVFSPWNTDGCRIYLFLW